MQMRVASDFGKVMSHILLAASAADVFEAATLGGAQALRRTDRGRLAPGAKADIVVIDLETRDSLRFGPIRDPIKALVECGIGDDVVTVIVDGVVRMCGGQKEIVVLRLPPQPRIEQIAQTVPEKVDPEDCEQDGEPREDSNPSGHRQVVAPLG